MRFQFGCACMVLVMAAAAARGADGAAAAEVTRSRGLVTQQKLDEALAAADAAVAADPTDRPAQLQRAWVLGLLGRRKECDGAYQALVNATPNDAEPFFQHGTLAFNNRNYFSSITDFTRALTRNPVLAEACLRRAEAAILVGHEAMAVSDLTHVIQVDEMNAEAYAWRAYVNRRTGNGSDADADLARANALAGGQKDQWAGIAAGNRFPVTTQKQGPAVAPLDCPEREEARKLNQAGMKWLPTDQELAIRSFERAQQADPTWGTPFCNQSMALVTYVLQNGGNLNRAFIYLYHGYELDPILIRAYETKLVAVEPRLEAMTALNEGSLRPSAEAAGRIGAIQDAQAAFAEGKRLRALNDPGQMTNALYAYLRVLQLDPLNSAARLERGKIVQFDAGTPRLQLALYNYSAALRLDPSNWEAYRYRATAWNSIRFFPAAEADDTAALVWKKDFAPLYMERAENIMAQGRDDDPDLAMGRKLDPQGYDASRRSIDQDLESFRQQIAAEKAAAEEWAQIWAGMARADHQARMGRANAADASGNHEAARLIREGG